MENRIMAALEEVVAQLQQAITDANDRFQNVGALQEALDAERAQYDALVASEAAEDVEQNQELQDAKAQTDELMAQMSSVADTLSGLTQQVNTLGQTASDQPAADNQANTNAAAADTGDTGTTANADAGDAGGDTTAEVSATDTTPSENPTDAAPTDTPTAGDVMRADAEAQANDPTSTQNMNPSV
jgi:septal ring factor EnvC (AmiA/AmiB activator)